MAEEALAPASDSTDVSVITPAADTPESMSINEAAKALADLRWNKKQPQAESATDATPAQESEPESPGDDAAPLQEASGEEPEAAEPAELPPIEPPRSWTKEEKEEFATYPREAQEKIARREQDRETALRRSQNEAADKLKGLTAKEQAAEQARKQYEEALPALLSTLQEQQQGEFSDIKTMADVEKLAREDWPRYALWDAQQKKIAAVAQEVNAAKERQASESAKNWSEYAAKQDQLLIERAPELADKSKASKIADAAVSVLKDIGFSDQELAEAWTGKASVSLRDHRLQLLILDGVKYRDAQKAPTKVIAPTVPPVQRPGAAQPKGSAAADKIQALQKQFEREPTLDNAHALRVAQSRRRA